MMKCYLPLICFFVAIGAAGQNKRSYYVVGDSAMFLADKIQLDSRETNAYSIRVIKNGIAETMTPNDISEFGTVIGDIFFSKEIDGKNVFLRRLFEGNLSLYVFDGRPKRFFMEDEFGSLVELESSNDLYKESLKASMRSCNKVEKLVEDIRFKESSFHTLFQRFENCSDRRVPEASFGILTGLFLSKVSPDAMFEFERTRPQVGVWAELPVKLTHLSFRTGLNYYSYAAKESYLGSGEDVDLDFEVQSVQIPLFLKYSSLRFSGGPYAQLGILLQTNFNEEVKVYSTSVSVSEISTQVKALSYPTFQIGGAAGVGYTLRKGPIPIGAEVRYQYLVGKKETASKVSGISLNLIIQI